jgi:hypothetical protein
MIGIAKKDSTVNLDVNPAFEKALPVLKTAWAILGLDCVVTSGRDGEHSKNSAHYSGNALDLRIWDISKHMPLVTFGKNLANALKINCGDGFYVVIEGDHIHLEYGLETTNIKGWVKGKLFYDGTVTA